ncbi:MAG: AI-2E family transporter [Gammaproteobacteria bacterium]|nr:AI-2E family transporter [Gammaproteobacteria bacterium]
MDFINDWFRRHFADKQLVILIVVMASIALAIFLVGNIMAPVIAAVIIAFLLQGAINRLEGHGVPHWLAFWFTFLTALAGFMVLLLIMLPIIFREGAALIQQIPSMMGQARRLLIRLPEEYPELITVQQVNDALSVISAEILEIGQTLLSYSFASAVTAFAVIVYAVLLPFMVFFMVRDKDAILAWMLSFLPEERPLTNQVWSEIERYIDAYIQGKVWEILIVGAAAYITFVILGLDYAVLLATITGLSVLIPYIGAFGVSIPVAFVAFYQFGLTPEFAYVVVAYIVIQVLDGNVLVPLLFSEAVSLHPVAIIIAIVFFGGLWGFWGIFFAIPLATVIMAVINAWPDLSDIPNDMTVSEMLEEQQEPGGTRPAASE